MPAQNDFSIEWDPLKAGVYDARVKAVDLVFNEPTAVRISYQTETEPPFGLSEYLPLDAPTSHPRYADTAQGKARVTQLAKATGTDPKSITSLDVIATLFTEARVRISVGSCIRDGLTVPIVRTILGPAQGPERQTARKAEARKNSAFVGPDGEKGI